MKKIQYHKNLYLDEGIDSADFRRIKKDLLDNPFLADVYLITRSLNESDQLDIYHSKYLAQKFYTDNPPYIIGIAKNREKTLALVKKIVEECVSERNDADLIAYLSGE